MPSKQQHVDRRTGPVDRRQWEAGPLPIVYEDGKAVFKDRRKQPDRRLNNIEVKELELQDVFPVLRTGD